MKNDEKWRKMEKNWEKCGNMRKNRNPEAAKARSGSRTPSRNRKPEAEIGQQGTPKKWKNVENGEKWGK